MPPEDLRSNEERFISGLLSGVGEALAAPSPEFPTVRCISRPALIRVLGAIRDGLAIVGHTKTSGTALLGLLVRSGLATPVALTARRPGLSGHPLYAFGLAADPEQLDPVELLQAFAPDGVVCYFTALSIHGLTTQLPTHHHIATLKPARHPHPHATDALSAEVQLPRTVDTPRPSQQLATHPLGTHQFSFQGLPYYTTQRESHRVTGVQIRYLSDKSQFRVTTLEQTLLDTLHRPASCGGAAIVFEAWETGASQLNAERLSALLTHADDHQLLRRAGHMLSRINRDADPALTEVLSRGESPTGHYEIGSDKIVPLIPGIPNHSIDMRWGVAAP